MKTLVNTLRFGDPDWLPKFVPTLESWCQRHGHTLKVWDNPTVWDHYPCPKFCEREMLLTFLLSNYERMLYIDADVWIHPEAPDFPKLKGLAAATDEHHAAHNLHFAGWCAAAYGREFPHWCYVNAGVWSIDRVAAKKLYRVWLPPYREFFQEQHFFNAAVCRAVEDEQMTFTPLSPGWNRWSEDKKPAWFTHFWGQVAKEPNEADLMKLKP